jgi:stearoyl-CoA desaturase (delta-9 desaturase)
MIILVIFIAHWYLCLFFQTFFLHRYASHKLYTMSAAWEKVFYFFTFITQGSSFLNPAAYAILHRKHHAYADTVQDPHSPKYIKNIFEFNKRTFIEYRNLVNQLFHNKIRIADVPRWPTLEKIAELLPVRTLFIFFYISIYWIFAPSIWYYLLIPLHIVMGPIHGFIVNWFGHQIGYRNFKELKDNSKNTLPVDLLMMGELYQNNHHKTPNNRNFAHRWFEIDLGYLFASLLQKLNVIQLNKGV